MYEHGYGYLLDQCPPADGKNTLQDTSVHLTHLTLRSSMDANYTKPTLPEFVAVIPRSELLIPVYSNFRYHRCHL